METVEIPREEMVRYHRHCDASPADALAMGPLAFWFLNHELESSELKRQIEELKAKGFAGFFLHPRGGLRIPYGPDRSRRWRETITFCVNEARRLGMEAWLYDEDPYPSGTAGGKVILNHPEYQAMELIPTVRSLDAATPIEVDLPEGRLIAAYLICQSKGSSRIERIDEEAGLVRSKWTQRYAYSGYYPPYEETDRPHWRAEASAPHYRVMLDPLPEAATLVAFVARAVIQNPWGAYTDLLNPAAVEAFLHYTHDAYAELLGPELGTTVPGIFTDEAKLKGRLPWSTVVPSLFEKETGRDLFDILPHLVLEIDRHTPYYRYLFRKSLASGLCKAMMEPMAARCKEHQLLLTGHVSPEEDPIGQVLYVPGQMGIIGRMDLPGTDLIGSLLGSREHPLLHLSPKLASSAAHGHGKRWITCESFAVGDWSQDMAALTRSVHWLYALGVNRIVSHGQFYSIDGLRKREAPPSQFFQASYWEHFQPFSEMIRLLSRELGRGRHQAPLLMYYPEESFMALVSGTAKENPVALRMRDNLGFLVHSLLTQGYDFDLADEELLLTSSADSGILQLGEEDFEAIIVPGLYLTEAAWAHLQEMEHQGIKVFYESEEITILGPSARRWQTGATPSQLHEEIRAHVTPLWQAEADLIGHQRLTNEGPLLFLCNNEPQPFRGSVTVNFPGPYEVCFPQEGIWRHTSLSQLELGAGLGLLIRPQQERRPDALNRGQELPVHWDHWRCYPHTENCVVLSEFQVLHSSEAVQITPAAFGAASPIDLLSPSHLTSSLIYEAGDRYLLVSFDWQGGNAAIRMVCDTELGEGKMEFYCNGAPLPSPSRKRTYDPMNCEVDLAPYVQTGRNHLIWIQRRSQTGPFPLPYDAIRLFGNFHVEFPAGRTTPALLTPRPDCYTPGFPASASQLGHPHYHGHLEYECDFVWLSQIPSACWLELGHVYESLEVHVNGLPVGTLWCEPWRVEIPEAVLRAGKNRLSLVCSTSPAAYLQALPRPNGFLGPIRLYAK